ncbi:MAG: YdeI/OmpD-associated family protein [Acidobacteriales bacterium]|nr:YdeI/OmpD-associated family protein [Terriglobales bacterium]
MPKAPKSPARSFVATLQRSGDKLNWVIITVPFDVAKIWGTRGQIKVKGEINGFGFRTSLFPDGKGGHILMVNKKMQAGGGVRFGMKAQFQMKPDTAKREVNVPKELQHELGRSKRLSKFYDSLSFSGRKWIADMVADRKQPESRVRSAQRTAEWLMEAITAERELPPMFQIAINRNPEVRRRWESMSANQRRGNILAVCYYRNPESRAKRLQKVVEMMMGSAKDSSSSANPYED